jgi:FkbM family methyltransferase
MTMKRIKDGVYRGVRATLRRVVGGAPGKYDDFNATHRVLLARAGVDVPVIFDVGAHVGESVRRFKALFPRSDMHSFEADSENFGKLRANTATYSGLTVNNFAAGAAPGRQTFYRNVKSDTSSFNPVNPGSQWAAARSKHHNVSVDQFTEKKYEVELKTIDGYMAEKNIGHIDI